jgi:hypothetical protein
MELVLKAPYINSFRRPYNDYSKSSEGKIIMDDYSVIIEDVLTPISAKEIKLELINEMEENIRECVAENNSISTLLSTSRTNAIRFIDQMAHSFPRPEVSVEDDGDIAFDWINKGKDYLSVSIGSGGYIHYAAVLGANKYHGKIGFDESIPEEISGIISKMY